MVEATGQQILDALEYSASFLPDEWGGFLQVSGIKFTVDMSVAASVTVDGNGMFVSVDGARKVKDVYVEKNGAWEELKPDSKYTVSSTTYILEFGGNGYTMFKNCPVIAGDIFEESQAIRKYLIDGISGIIGNEYEKTANRIIIN
jgi:hypothetical protein